MSLPWKFKINSKFPTLRVYGKCIHTCDVPEIGWRIWILWCLSSTCLVVVLHCTVSVHYSNGYFVPTCRALLHCTVSVWIPPLRTIMGHPWNFRAQLGGVQDWAALPWPGTEFPPLFVYACGEQIIVPCILLLWFLLEQEYVKFLLILQVRVVLLHLHLTLLPCTLHKYYCGTHSKLNDWRPVWGLLKEVLCLKCIKPNVFPCRLFKTDFGLRGPVLVCYTFRDDRLPAGVKHGLQLHTTGSPSRVLLDPHTSQESEGVGYNNNKWAHVGLPLIAGKWLN